MSRIGKLPVTVPDGIEVKIAGNTITVKGKKGTLSQQLHPEVEITVDANAVNVLRKGDKQNQRALHGLYRSLINNMVTGVSKGFRKSLEINGIGYRANVQGQVLQLNLGYSHPIKYTIPKDIVIEVDRNFIHIDGADKQKVGQVAADIRDYRPVEPYKGKGIRYVGEYVRKKVGKTGA